MSSLIKLSDHNTSGYGLLGDNSKWNESIPTQSVCTINHELSLMAKCNDENLTRLLEICLGLFAKKSVGVDQGIS